MREKRKYIRLQAAIGVAYHLIKKQKRRKEALSLIRNIGGGGLSIIAKDDLREGDLVDMEIHIPHLEEPIRAVGEVMWFSHLKEADREVRDAGIRFLDLEPKDRHRILEYVHAIGIG